MKKTKKKPPKLFRRPLSSKNLENKVMKRIYLKQYRDNLDKLLVRDQGGVYSVRPDLSKKETRQLKKIATSVRKNTGFVEKGKLIFLVAATVIIIAFNVFFKDMLVELAAEAGLRAVFQARADISNLKFQVLAGRIAFDHAAVANKNKPMRNLFELGRTEFKIDVQELLKNNIVIDNIMCHDIRWNTPRTFSGALPGAQPPSSQTREDDETDDSFSLLNETGGIAEDILEREKDNLQSLKILDRITSEYPDRIHVWEKKIDESHTELESVSASVDKAKGINPKKIKTPAAAADALAVVSKAYQDVTGFQKDLEKTYKEFKKDRAAVESDRKDLDRSMQADLARLTDLLGNPLGVGKKVVSTLLNRLLARYLGDVWVYANQARGYADSLKPEKDQAGQDKDEPAERHYGFINFPGAASPKFWLKSASASVDLSTTEKISASLSHVTGEPDKIGKPAAFTFERQAGGTVLHVEGIIDGRKTSPLLIGAFTQLTGQPFTMEEGIPALNLETVSGTLDGGFEFALTKDGRTSGKLSLTLKNPQLTKGSDSSPFTDLAFRVLHGLPVISVSGSYRILENGTFQSALDSNLDEALVPVIKQLLDEQLGQAKIQLKTEFEKLLEEKLGDHGKIIAQYTDLDKLLAGDLSSVKDFAKILEKKKKEIAKATAGSGLLDLKKLKF